MRKILNIKYIFTLILFAGSISAWSQNLVLNPSFESVNTGALQCSWYTTQGQFNSAINNWTCPTGGSSDIFVTSLATSCFSSPNSTNGSGVGTQTPRTGSVMVGGSLYGSGGCTPYREYFQGKLSAVLTPGTTYKIEFYVSLADKASSGCNNIGVKFSTTPVNVSSMCVYSAVPDVNYTGAPITDKLGWTKLEFCFTPSASGLQHFMIGNFFDNASTTSASLSGSFANAYYYLDDVSIVPSSSINVVPSASVTSVCGSPTFTLDALPAGVNYTWTAPGGGSIVSGTNAQNAVVQGNGIYTLSVQNPSACVSSVVSTTVSVNPAAGSLTTTMSPAPAITCSVPTSTLFCNVSAATSYSWSGPGILSGASTASPIVNQPGIYSVVVTNTAGCTGTSTVSVAQNTVVPVITISPANATVSCTSPTVQLTSTITPSASSFTWSSPPGGSLSNPSITNPVTTGTGIFTLTATDPSNGCINSGTVNIIPGPTSLTLSITNTIICNGDSALLSVNGNASTYSWTPASSLSSSTGNTVIAHPGTTTSYTVAGSTGTCTAATVVTVSVQATPTLAIIPSNQTICQGSTSSPIIAAGGPSYTWSPSTSLSSSTGNSVTASPSVTTIYTITSGIGTCTSSAQATVTIVNNPSITVSGNTLICNGASTTLTANGANNYLWSPALTLSSPTASVVVANPTTTTTYTVNGSLSTCTAVAYVTVNVSPLPPIVVSPSQSVCAGSSATLTASGAASYSWAPFANLSSSTGSIVISNPGATTMYTVTASDGVCTNTAVTTVSLNPIPSVSVSPSNPSICSGASITLTASGASTYTWSPSAGLNAVNGNSVIASPTTLTTYTVQGNLAGCSAQTLAVVFVNPLPTLTISPNATICSGSTASLVVGGASSYTWFPMTGLTTTNGINVSASPSISSTYTIMGTSAAGCPNTTTVSVTVEQMPSLTVTANPTIICQGNSSLLQASGTTSYTWNASPTLSSLTTSSTNATPLSSTIYTVNASNNGLCVVSQTVQVVVTSTITVSIPGVNPVCFGESTHLIASGGTSYTWSPATDVTSPYEPSTTVKPAATTVYTVTINNNGLCTAQGTVEIIVHPLPLVNAGADTTINIDEIVTLHGTGNTTVGFLPTNGIPLECNLCDVITVNPQEPTCYLLKGVNTYGCVAYDEVCVDVTKDWNIYIPNAFSPNNDLRNDVFAPVGYGISEIKLLIFDRWGAQIFASESNTPGWDGKVKGKVCEQGVYIYRVEIKTMGGKNIEKVGHVTLLPK